MQLGVNVRVAPPEVPLRYRCTTSRIEGGWRRPRRKYRCSTGVQHQGLREGGGGPAGSTAAVQFAKRNRHRGREKVKSGLDHAPPLPLDDELIRLRVPP